MKPSKRVLTVLLLGALCSGLAQAQWPERPITWIVPFAAGGPVDVVSRPVAKKLGEILNTPVVVENRPGAGGAMGIDFVARAKPDGYTVALSSVGTQTIVPYINSSVKYDPMRSFTNIGTVARYTNVLVVKADSRFKSLGDLVQVSKQSDANVTFGSAGNGSSNHLSGELLRMLTGGSMQHVPYKGSALAMTDLLGGNITFMFDTVNTSAPRIQSGHLRALAVTSAERSQFLPQVPTMRELGVSGASDAGAELWWGLVGPKGIPEPVVSRLNAALREALNSAEVQTQFKNQYVETWGTTPQEFDQVVLSSRKVWQEVVKEANLRADQ